jgi:hypothetical protein
VTWFRPFRSLLLLLMFLILSMISMLITFLHDEFFRERSESSGGFYELLLRALMLSFMIDSM